MQAKEILDQLNVCDHLPPLARFNLGWFYGRAHEFHSALKIFASLPSTVPDYATHQYAIALTEFEVADYRASVEVLKDLQSRGQLDERSANLLGVSYSKLGLYGDAYPILAKELKQNPADLIAYLNLITLFSDTGNFAQAFDIANQAAMVFPENSEVFVVRGAIQILLGGFHEAHSDFETAVQLTPRAAEPRFLLALSDYKQKKFETAIAELKTALRSGIHDADLHYLLAECIVSLDHTKSSDAMDELNDAIALNSKSVSARTMRGRLLLEAGDAPAAIVDLEVARNADPGSHSATYSLARAYKASGRSQDAKLLYDELRTGFAADLTDQRNAEALDELSQRKLNEVLTGGTAP